MKTLAVRLKSDGLIRNANGKPIGKEYEAVPDNALYRALVREGSLEQQTTLGSAAKTTKKDSDK